MTGGRARAAMIALFAVAVVVVIAINLSLMPRKDDPVASLPVRLETLSSELFHVDAAQITRRGPPRMWVLRLDPSVELEPVHFKTAGLAGPKTIEEWADFLQSSVVFNAGQFDENLDHLGWLKGNGVWIQERRHKKWMALLVSGSITGAPWSGIIDLTTQDSRIVGRYRDVLQSMMLIDDRGRVRVRESELSACRTVVAQDRRGRLLVLTTEGAVTLAELARWLPGSGLDIVRAMNLDGGVEAQLAVRTPELNLTLYGQYGTGTTVFDGSPGRIRYPLPAVIAAKPSASAGAGALKTNERSR